MTTPLDTWERALRSRVAAALPRVTVVIGALPAKPNRALAVKAYADPVPADPADTTRRIRFQVRTRQDTAATPPTANADAETAQEALLGHGLTLLDGAPQARITHLSTATLGLDSDGRDERTDNYLLLTTRD
ncbi:minor capsid protein [Actinomyces urogenitalis]|uniref:minor capsid protein n=1 Tax=Actinomyces urogenitalis TaxID=103621 RepID=UPI0028FF692B|nr:minor capsid protein [Actinomyces urogenitalis]MDU0864419.1 minor capsid protein [Actinomyces urogenitalis]MDU0874965.1 minor capsid protein [Actinomyces urogenitalis]MDU1565364.1 minor capsid protein [Actinomyces urogenitalis]MDU1640607.1 minor capsid protein [Actinomyces urogenitalis]MDU6777781.1 minor capsid protein [Actinomyces urogenitalis]